MTEQNKISGKYHLAILYCLVFTILWAITPISIRALLKRIDAYTLSFYRYFFSFIILFIYMIVTKRDIPFIHKKYYKNDFISIIICGITFAYCHYVYAVALKYISPTAAIIVFQAAPLMFFIGDIIIFKENIKLSNLLGYLLVIVGIFIYFYMGLKDLLLYLDSYIKGIYLALIASALWFLYAMFQKKLIIKKHSSLEIMFSLCLIGTISMLPNANLGEIRHIRNTMDLSNMIIFVLALVIAYSLFAESQKHWEAYKSSIFVSITPLATYLCVIFASVIFPSTISLPPLNLLGFTGIFIVVIGSMVTIKK
jgi:drug/metabolite transporter (DMT)-like permease